ncbi:MAG: ADP-ribosylglycohydrolase family protein [Leptospirillia bacterium]
MTDVNGNQTPGTATQPATAPDPRARIRGSLLGLAVGDALGLPYEGAVPGSFTPVIGMAEGAGIWSDDTSMALCLAESLVTCGGFDPADQADRYVKWLNEGHLTPTGKAFGIGRTVLAALTRYQETGDPHAGPTDPGTAGNGCIMRLAPVPLFFSSTPAEAVYVAGESARITHGASAGVDACRYLGALLVGAMHGVSKQHLLDAHFTPVTGLWEASPLCAPIDAVAGGSFKRKKASEIRASAYVVESLEAALWALLHSENFEEAVLRAVNLGYDTDTTAAITGQLAGALYGEAAIPEAWLERLEMKGRITALADALTDAAP